MAEEDSSRVLVLAPIGRDGPVIAELLRRVGLPSRLCGDLADFGTALDDGVAAAVIAEEALFSADLSTLSAWIKRQPPWSDLPFIVLTSHQSQPVITAWRQKLVTILRNVSMLERPVQGITLASTVQAAVRARVRQYELRALLHAQAQAAHRLEQLVADRTRELEEANEALRTQMTERARAEEALRHGQKMEAIGQLTGGIAHDFNNMLQGIMGSLEIAQRQLERGRTAQVARFLDIAHEAARRSGVLTQRLLAFARRQRLDPRPVDPDELISGLAELIHRTVGPEIQVELRVKNGNGGVLCDPVELESTLLNLCINARDAMPDGGRLVIGTDSRTVSVAAVAGPEEAAPGDYTVIWVKDTGTGIPPDVLSRVFEPFFTTKPMGQGTGLGLSQVYGFVRQSGGFVQLQSALGQGTTVRLFLPRHARMEADVGSLPAPAKEEIGAGETVLLVDDEELVRQAAAARLRELDYHVLEAEDGPSAMRVVQTASDLALLITDVGLPNGMNGRQLAEAIREQRPGLPVLFITGYSGTILPSGVEVIGKPFDLETLVRRVRAILVSNR
ncbi:MAG: ATP-binding protein [Acetobacteraceae bacterium]